MEPYVSSFPRLHPHMLWRRHAAQPFPFTHARATYYYLARNGVYAMASAWRLAGQEVLVPAYCHGVEVAALQHAGVDVRYYPVRGGMTVCCNDIVSRVTPRTRAIYLIHYLGFPGPVQELAAVCRSAGMRLIEDCSLSLLSRLHTRPLGSFGDAAVFCLYKTLPLPNGAVIVVNKGRTGLPGTLAAPTPVSTLSYTMSAALRRATRPAMFSQAELSTITAAPGGNDRSASTQPRAWVSTAREQVKPIFEKFGMQRVATRHFDAETATVGMSGVCHRLIAAQDFAAIVETRRRNYRHLLSRLDRVVHPVFSELPEGVCPLHFPFYTPHKETVHGSLMERGIQAVSMWSSRAPGIRSGEYPEVDDLRRTVIELPCHQDLTPDVIDWIADEVVRLRTYL